MGELKRFDLLDCPSTDDKGRLADTARYLPMSGLKYSFICGSFPTLTGAPGEHRLHLFVPSNTSLVPSRRITTTTTRCTLLQNDFPLIQNHPQKTTPPWGPFDIFRRQASATRCRTVGTLAGSDDCLQAAAVAIPNAEPQGHFLRSLVTPAFAWTVASVAFILFCSGLVKPRVDSQTRIGHRPNLPASQKLQSTFELPQQRLISALVSPSAR